MRIENRPRTALKPAAMNAGYAEHLDWVRERRKQLKNQLAEIFPTRTQITLEIGCGHGHWLADYAAVHPEKNCLGVDIIRDRIERARKKANRAGAANASFVRAEAFEALDLMPEHVRLDQVFILFPDPWPKKRHWKKRLFSTNFLAELGKRSASGVRCHFRTDYDPYFAWAVEVVEGQSLWRREPEFEWPFERETVFQSRAMSYQSLVLVRE